MAAAVSDFLGLGLTFGPGLSRPTGQHPGGEHHGAGGAIDETQNETTAGSAGSASAGGGPMAFDAVTTTTEPAVHPPTPVASTSAREG
jgi:hypothetical protein